MWPLDLLFGGKKRAEGFAAEAEQVLADREDIVKLRQSLYPTNRDDLKQNLKWYSGRIPILQNKHYHPVAKLSFSKRYDEMVVDYVNKLRQADAGDNAAIAEVKEIKSKAERLVNDELDYLKFKISKWENIGEKAQAYAADKDWTQEKEKAEKQLAEERELFEVVNPKNREDMTQWRSYYQQRIARLELPKKTLSPVVKMVWITSIKRNEREKKIQEYLGVLDKLIA